MELLQLRYFLEVAKTEHLTKSAEKLMIAPPSLSASIKKLEAELGISLFDRGHRRIKLNENGRKFYLTVQNSLKILDEGIAQIKPKKDVQKLKIGLTSQSVYTEMIYAYEQSQDAVSLEVKTLNFNEIQNESELNKCDFYLGVIEDLDSHNRRIVKLCDVETPVIMISKNNALSKKKVLCLNDLKNIPFISISHENSSAHEFLMRIFKKSHFEPCKLYQGTYMIRQKMVLENKAVGLTTMVGAAANALFDPSITFIPLGGANATRTQSISWDKNKKLSEYEKKFVNFAKKYFKNNPWT